MKVIPPLAIVDAMVTSSSVVETAPAAYNAGATYAAGDTASVAGAAGLLTVYRSLQAGNTGHAPGSSPDWWTSIGETYQAYSGAATYAAGDRVLSAAAHLVYESLVAGNTGNALTDATKWLRLGPSNAWAMFDLLRNTASVQPGSLSVQITPGERVNSIALLGMVANAATITVTSGGVEVYSHVEDLNTREVASWYEYFFAEFSTQPSLVLFDLPPYTDAVIDLALTATSGNVELGALVVGSYVDIGQVQAQAESDVLNFSTVTRDFDGGVSAMVQRRNVPKSVQSIWLPKSRVNRVRRLRDALNGSPGVWAALDDSDHDYFESLLILGFYKRFSMNHRHADYVVVSLELEEI